MLAPPRRAGAGRHHRELSRALSAAGVGLGVVVFVQVTLATHSPDNSKRFRASSSGLDEVQEAYALTGDADYLVKLAVPDLKALSHMLNEVFLPHESVAHVRSSIVLDHLKQSARLPLAHLAVTAGAGSKRTPRKGRSHTR